jgi:predicted NAD/FAD-binding protein
MQSMALIGTGIAGMACGHFLHPHFDLTIYEKNDYIGGHTHTVFAEEDRRSVPIDTGFMVYNEVTYPHLTKLFETLGVATQSTTMSFSVQHVPTGLEFCGSGLSGLFAQRKNILNFRFWKLLLQIDRFNRDAPSILENPTYENYTLKRYAAEQGYGYDFLEKYLIPMSSAVWSTPPAGMLEFPVVTLVRFFKNHGFLGLHTQHPWRTVIGGSWSYRDKLIRPFRDRIRVKTPAVRVTRRDGKAFVTDSKGETRSYDKVILASHADESLALLEQPTPSEKEKLGAFTYQKNVATLHTDTSIMPQTRSTWSSWNYRAEKSPDGKMAASTIYWMNSLQKVSDKKNYFVSINDPRRVRPDHILQEIAYEHPVFTLASLAAQKELSDLNENGVTYFCGSYFRYGFHEDALDSALQVVKSLGVTPWA